MHRQPSIVIQDVQTMDQLIQLVKADLMAPRLTVNSQPSASDFSELSTARINQIDQFASEQIDQGQKKIYIRFRESEFPRTTAGEAKTYKMDARFPLPDEPGESPSRYGVTKGGHAVRKCQKRGELPTHRALTNDEVKLIIEESIMIIISVREIERLIREKADVPDPSQMCLYGLNGMVYDISKPVQQIIRHLTEKAEARKEAKKVLDLGKAPIASPSVTDEPAGEKIKKLIAEKDRIIRKNKESAGKPLSYLQKLKADAMRVQNQLLRKFYLVNEARELFQMVVQSIDVRIEAIMAEHKQKHTLAGEESHTPRARGDALESETEESKQSNKKI